MLTSIVEQQLVATFKGRELFSRDELWRFLRNFDPDLTEGTFGWKIYDLKNRHVIIPVRRGYYTISGKPLYQPEVGAHVRKVAKLIQEKFGETSYCLWETGWLNEFSRHQTPKNILMVEVEKQMCESVFFAIRDTLHLDAFLQPDEQVIALYLSESKTPVVVKRLITRSPVTLVTEKKISVSIPLIEKLLVDIFADKALFHAYQGSELAFIYESAIKSYPINYTKLLSYAARRDCDSDIKQFMIRHLSHLVKEILH